MRGSAKLAILVALVACGGRQNRIEEIPPIDEEAQQTEHVDTPVEENIQRDDLGVLSFVPMQSESPMVTIRVSFDVGSAEDPSDARGLTNLTATLMTEGGAGDKSFAELTEALYPMAASIATFTDRDQTVFVGRVHRDHLAEFYPLFRDVLTRPAFNAEDLERVKARMLSDLTLGLRGNNDEELGKQAMQAMLYEGHPYAHPALGTESGLNAITRERVVQHASQMFCGGRATLGMSGAYTDELANQVRTDLAALGGDNCLGRRVLPSQPQHGVRVWLVEKPEAQSVAISLGVPIDVTRDHPDYPALVLAAAYLGQHRTTAGRLMIKIREDRGINYGDYAYIEHFHQEGRTRFPRPNTSRRQQYFSAWIRPVQTDHAHFSLRLALREIRAFVREGLSEEDFQSIRTFVDRYYALYLQTESRRLGFAIDDRYYDMVDPWIDTLRNAWREMTREQVNTAIRRNLSLDHLQIAIVTANANELADTLGSDAPSPFEHRGTASEEIRAEDETVSRYPLGVSRERMTVVPVGSMFQ